MKRRETRKKKKKTFNWIFILFRRLSWFHLEKVFFIRVHPSINAVSLDIVFDISREKRKKMLRRKKIRKFVKNYKFPCIVRRYIWLDNFLYAIPNRHQNRGSWWHNTQTHTHTHTHKAIRNWWWKGWKIKTTNYNFSKNSKCFSQCMAARGGSCAI